MVCSYLFFNSYITGDFYVVNTYLNYIMWNVTTIKGKAFVHGNRFLEGESLDILMDLTVHGGADIQPVPGETRKWFLI